MKLPCELIRDLLPLYAEHLTHPETDLLIEEHLQACPACREELHTLCLPVPVQADPQADAPLKRIHAALRKRQLLTLLAALLAAACVFALAVWMYSAKTLATVEEAQFWTYNRKESSANLCILEVQGENVWLTTDPNFNWGQTEVTVQAVRYRFPHFHVALAEVFGSTASSKTVAVSNTQLLTVECADEVLHYRKGESVFAYRVNGSIVYGTDQQLHLYPRA